MEDNTLCTIKLNAGSRIELPDHTIVEFNSPMIVKLRYGGDVIRYITGTMIDLGDDISLQFTLDKEAHHENRTPTIPEGSKVC